MSRSYQRLVAARQSLPVRLKVHEDGTIQPGMDSDRAGIRLWRSPRIKAEHDTMAVAEEPSYESATRDVLLTSAKLIGSSCVDVNLAFSRCKAQETDPEACLKLGGEVLSCTNSVLRKISSKCPESFETYRKCMDKTQMRYPMCRKEEKHFHDCYHAPES